MKSSMYDEYELDVLLFSGAVLAGICDAYLGGQECIIFTAVCQGNKQGGLFGPSSTGHIVIR
jgi:hypothetical protein